MSIIFAKRRDAVYPGFMLVDGYCINLEDELIQSLKEITQVAENNQFLSLVINKVATNAYLREMVHKNIAKEPNPPAFVLKLRNHINNL